MAFDAHGSYEISIQGEVIVLSLEGSWNLEQAKTFFEAYKPFILKQGFTRFGVLTDFRSLEGGTPDAIAYFEEISVWAMEQGQVARAQVLDSSLKAYIVDQATKDKNLFAIQSFEDKDKALDWMASLGLEIS
jgi:hypothetical protein